MNRRNLLFLQGNLTNDPRVNTFQKTDKDGNNKEVVVCNFTVAVDGGRDGKSNETCFINGELWDSGATTFAEQFRKGDCVRLEGNLKNKEWTNKEGEKKRDLIIRVSHFQPISFKETVEA